jgi:hypothetical protein
LSPARVIQVVSRKGGAPVLQHAVVFEEFEHVIAPGGAGLVISSMAGHMLPALPPEQDHALAFTPAGAGMLPAPG